MLSLEQLKKYFLLRAFLMVGLPFTFDEKILLNCDYTRYSIIENIRYFLINILFWRKTVENTLCDNAPLVTSSMTKFLLFVSLMVNISSNSNNQSILNNSSSQSGFTLHLKIPSGIPHLLEYTPHVPPVLYIWEFRLVLNITLFEAKKLTQRKWVTIADISDGTVACEIKRLKLTLEVQSYP